MASLKYVHSKTNNVSTPNGVLDLLGYINAAKYTHSTASNNHLHDILAFPCTKISNQCHFFSSTFLQQTKLLFLFDELANVNVIVINAKAAT